MNDILQYWHWIVFGFGLIALEIVLPTFMALWLGVAALITGIVLFLVPELALYLQLLVWISFSIITTFVWFTFFQNNATDKTLAGLGREAVIGQIGLVLIDASIERCGKLRLPAPILGNDEWEFIVANSLDNSQKPAVGDRVKVIEIAGNRLVVEKI